MADYCAIADVQNRLSADGVTYRTDDTPPTTYGDVLDEASREIDFYLLARYDGDLLATSDWVKHQCAVIAAFLLCERRGNPVPRGIAGKYERTIAKLEKIQTGTGNVGVPGIVERRTAVPTMSNVRIRLDPAPRTVVERNRSTTRNRPQDYVQHADRLEWFDPSI